MQTRANDLAGITLANGRYQVISKLGEGGMGFVYRALDHNIDSDVVIKIPRQAMMDDPEFASRFTREIRSLVKLSHPHIVKVSDVGTWESTPFAVMQFLPGGSLEDQRPSGYGDQPQPCDPGTVPRWLDAVARALDYIHSQGYIHRDVKPGNILFDAHGHAFLSDFGVAKVMASTTDKHPSQTAMTGTGMVLGTPEYMAPELIMGEAFDGRVDQYALAVTVYELLCGRRPFENETKTKVLVLHTTKASPRLTEWCSDLPERLSQAVLKGLSKAPDDRYPNCVALAAAVSAAAEGVVAREERVRLKCPGCGKRAGTTAAEFAKIRESGRRPSCPQCKLPLEILKDETGREVPPGVGQGGTVVMSGTGISGEYALTTDPPPTRGATAAYSPVRTAVDQDATGIGRGGTMAMSSPPSRSQQPTDPEPRPISPRRDIKTLIERPMPESDQKSASHVLNAPQETVVVRLKRSSLTRTRVRIAIGASAVVSMLVLAIVVMLFMPGKGTRPPVPAPDPITTPLVAASTLSNPPLTPSQPRSSVRQSVTTRDRTTARVPVGATGSLARTSDSLSGNVNRPNLNPNDGLSTPTENSPTVSNNGPGPALSSRGLVGAEASSASIPAAGSVVRPRFDPAVLKQKPIKAKYPMDKVLAESRSRVLQAVIPTGMYHLARSPNDRRGGQRKYEVVARNIESRKNNTLGVNSSAPIDVEVEPNLVELLDRLEANKLKDKMSILTLWFNTEGDPVLVKVEILQEYITRFKYSFEGPRGDDEYMTLVVTPEEAKLQRSPDEDWDQVGRMLHFSRNFKNRVKAYRNMLQIREQNLVNSAMSNLFADVMRAAAVQEAKDRQVRNSMGFR